MALVRAETELSWWVGRWFCLNGVLGCVLPVLGLVSASARSLTADKGIARP